MWLEETNCFTKLLIQSTYIELQSDYTKISRTGVVAVNSLRANNVGYVWGGRSTCTGIHVICMDSYLRIVSSILERIEVHPILFENFSMNFSFKSSFVLRVVHTNWALRYTNHHSHRWSNLVELRLLKVYSLSRIWLNFNSMRKWSQKFKGCH